MRKYILLIIVILTGLKITAQSENLPNKSFQATFFYPVGMYPLECQDYEYELSFNALVGRTGAVNGMEIGGWVNFNDKYVKGLQVAGIGNLCNGPVEALQVGGIFNISNGDFDGFQAGGIVNLVHGKVDAVQIGGIANLSFGFDGVQVAGISNFNTKEIDGIQLAGITNFTLGQSDAVQVSGIVNVAEDLDGMQVGGILNAAKSMNGFQLAGIANVAKNVDGVQLAGIINICDSIDGVPIAPLSFVRKNGYRRFQVSTNEIYPINIAYKTGVRKFYTFFKVGINQNWEENNVSYGMGMGTSFVSPKGRSALNIELSTEQITSNFYSSNYKGLYRLSTDFSFNPFRRIEIFGGPTLNVIHSLNQGENATIAPDWAKSFTYNTNYWGWLGFHAGLRF